MALRVLRQSDVLAGVESGGNVNRMWGVVIEVHVVWSKLKLSLNSGGGMGEVAWGKGVGAEPWRGEDVVGWEGWWWCSAPVKGSMPSLRGIPSFCAIRCLDGILYRCASGCSSSRGGMYRR